MIHLRETELASLAVNRTIGHRCSTQAYIS